MMKRWMTVAGLVLFTMAAMDASQAAEKESLRAYIVHHAKPAFKKLMADFEQETGIHVESGIPCRTAIFEILSQNKDGDLCITSGAENLEKVVKEGLSKGPVIPVGDLITIIAVAKGNPKKIETLADLGKPGVRIAMSRSGCMTDVANRLLAKTKLADKLTPNITLPIPGPDHSKVVEAVAADKADATIIWLWVVREVASPKVEVVTIPADQNIIEPVGALVLETGKNKAGAEKFAAFLQGDKARKLLTDAGLRQE